MSAAPAVAATSKPSAPPPAPLKFVPSQLLDVDLIEADPENPRKDFPKEEMQQLTNSILLRGVEQAIEVRPIAGGRYRITFGERRWRAAKAAGLKQIPATVKPRTDLDASDVQLAENLDRADLSPLEIAGGYQRQLTLGRTMDQVCERAGKKRSAVYATLQLLQLGDAGRKALGEEKISASVAQLVARVPKSLQQRALSLVEGTQHQEPLSYRDAVSELQQAFTVELKKATFDTKDEKLCPGVGSCEKCPKRSGNAVDLFPDIKNPDTCTDKACFDAKTHADVKRAMDAKGYKLLSPKEAPPEDIFWNQGTGALKADKYLEPDTVNYDDTQNRKYRDLLTAEDFKKLAVVVLDGNGKPRQLLPKAGLARELKKGGIFKEKTKRAAAAPTPSKSSKPAVYKPPPKTIDELADAAVAVACIETVEKKGPTPELLKLMAIEALFNSETVYERRGLKELGYGVTEKQFDATFGKLSANQLFGVLFDALVADRRYVDGDGFDDLAKQLGVDVKTIKKSIERTTLITWSTAGKKTLGKGKSGRKYSIAPSPKGFSLEWTSVGGSAFEGSSSPHKTVDVAKESALRHEEATKPAKKAAKKGGGK